MSNEEMKSVSSFDILNSSFCEWFVYDDYGAFGVFGGVENCERAAPSGVMAQQSDAAQNDRVVA